MKTELIERPPAAEPATDETDGEGADLNTRLAWLRTQLAIERTLMAWNRTSLSLIGFGFTIYQFLKKVQESVNDGGGLREQSPRNFGLAFLAVGTLGTLVALWQYSLFVKYLRRPEFRDIAIREGMPHTSLPLVITVFLAIIGIATTTWVLLGG